MNFQDMVEKQHSKFKIAKVQQQVLAALGVTVDNGAEAAQLFRDLGLYVAHKVVNRKHVPVVLIGDIKADTGQWLDRIAPGCPNPYANELRVLLSEFIN